MPEYRVFFHLRVSSQLERHAEFIARVSPPAAYRMKKEFDATVARLGQNPYQFPLAQNPTLPADVYRTASFAKWYQLVFSVEGNMVYIDAVAASSSRAK